MKRAFTLAEVLITLTIIGVIAALTIPNLMQKWSDHADVAKVKEANSILNNAIRMAISERGDISDWGWPEKTDYEKTKNAPYCASILKNYLKAAKDCTNNRIGECRTFYYKDLQGNKLTGGSNINNYYYNVLVLQNGMTVACFPGIIGRNTDYESLILRVDINGSKEPNRRGYDIFQYSYALNGTPVMSFESRRCNAMEPYSIADDLNGAGCVKWIMKHGNMDYKYRDVSAEW